MSLATLLGIGKQREQIPKQEIYDMVKAYDLTPEELRSCKLPDDYLDSIWVFLLSPTERDYVLTHTRGKRRKVPYIGLYTRTERDKTDFATVETIVTQEVGGDLSMNYDSDSGQYASLRKIPLRENPTQVRVADWIEAYEKHFRDIKIGPAYFFQVPESVVQNSGLPPKKLSLFQRYKILRIH